MTQGLYNTDLMMLLIEPIMYLIIAIAEEYEIEPVIYEGMDQDIADEEDFDTDDCGNTDADRSDEDFEDY